MQTVLEILKKTEAYFARAGIEKARLDAEWLLAHALGCKRLDLYLRFDQPLTEEALAPLRELVRRRARREPLQHILGTVEFDGLEIAVDGRVLIPRPETELLLERLLAHLDGAVPARIADLGTGSGILALALARRFPESAVTGVDRSPEAIAVARENARRNGLNGRITWAEGAWFAPLEGRFDLIVANPPYLSEADWEAAAPEVRAHEPRAALVADEGGTGDLLHLIKEAPARLNPNGWLALETNIGQHAALLEAAASAGFAARISETDWTNRERFLFLRSSSDPAIDSGA